MEKPPADRVNSWQDLQSWHNWFADQANSKKRWVYRAQRDADWELVPSLERALKRHDEPFDRMRKIESRLVREFQRHLHRYSSSTVEEADDLRWLALMQHHGAPTRLLDWTYSFLTAVYFAAESVEPKVDPENPELGAQAIGAIWALDFNWCWDRVKEELPSSIFDRLEANDKDPQVTRELLQATKYRLVLPLNPFRLDERLAVQQGLFVVPLDLTVNYMENLRRMGTPVELSARVLKLTIKWTPAFLRHTLIALHERNMTRRTLYPGLDGLATGLQNFIPMIERMPLHQDR